MEFTDLEKLVFNKAVDICFSDPNTSVKELAEKLELEVATVKGVIGSLVKKEKIAVDEEDRGRYKTVLRGKKVIQIPVPYITVYPIVNGQQMGYGWDQYSVAEKEGFKL